VLHPWPGNPSLYRSAHAAHDSFPFDKPRLDKLVAETCHAILGLVRARKESHSGTLCSCSRFPNRPGGTSRPSKAREQPSPVPHLSASAPPATGQFSHLECKDKAAKSKDSFSFQSLVNQHNIGAVVTNGPVFPSLSGNPTRSPPPSHPRTTPA
jgi:hypothetical protein